MCDGRTGLGLTVPRFRALEQQLPASGDELPSRREGNGSFQEEMPGDARTFQFEKHMRVFTSTRPTVRDTGGRGVGGTPTAEECHLAVREAP